MVKACLNKGRVLAQQGKLVLAQASLDRALAYLGTRTGPTTIKLHLAVQEARTDLLKQQGQYASASRDLQAALEQLPTIQDQELGAAAASAVNSLGYHWILDAKQLWTQTQTRGPAVQQKLKKALETLREAKAKEAETDVQAMLLGNQAYALFLLGREAEARPLLEACLRQGGEELYKGELEDTTLVPCPPDKGFKALVEKTWKRVKPKVKTP